MTEAAFRASYSDWKVIKGRKVVQIVFEMPLEMADEAYQALGGMPIAAHEVWCGIARLKGGDQSARSVSRDPETPPRPAMTPKSGGADKRPLALSSQAALRCKDARFRAFLKETGRRYARDEAEAREYVLEYCGGINSRSEILQGTEAETYWLQLERAYADWQTAERAFA